MRLNLGEKGKERLNLMKYREDRERGIIKMNKIL